MLPSLICLVGGVGDLDGGGDCWDCGVHRPTSVGALDGFGPVVVVAAL